ncbi:branched-chain amino acid ABC transporter permease [Spongiactinospora gelatinilytica]|uniref:Branched-chain amino acid ABC transporter permease n=1 Tax=Spongiactinospora gelatinilytica TaxID=2666298 RepID=A0A2W2I7B0_9ACTN|nr:branched-chain amino acid ABC transporter permease [Spongiactinospora gelatinilytica]PZG53997.1 branched-chain amino acid ABC transporter permease [Spongiactinospora gelatinilytica]
MTLSQTLIARAAQVRVSRAARSSKVSGAAMALIAVVLAALPFLVFSTVTDTLVNLFVLIALASMWNLLAGFGGLVSVGQQAYIGIGAYSVIALADQGVQPYLAVPLGALTCALFAVPTSWLAFRLRGDYFAVGTWVIAEVYRLLVVRIDGVGGGSGKGLSGMSGIDQTLRGALTYWIALALALATIGGCYLLLRGRVGLSLMAVRDEETAASSAGIDVTRAKRLVYLISAAGCGAAGGVITISSLSVNPDAIFSVQWSAYMIFIVVIGGIGYIEGPLLGALVFFALQQVLADYGSWYLVLLGAVGVAAALWLPGGLWGLVRDRTGLSLFPVGYHVREGGGDAASR